MCHEISTPRPGEPSSLSLAATQVVDAYNAGGRQLHGQPELAGAIEELERQVAP